VAALHGTRIAFLAVAVVHDDPPSVRPDAFYARLTELAASGELGSIHEVTSPDDNLQAVFQYLVKS